MAHGPVLTRDALNRATLARQSLLEREAVPPPEMIQRLAGVQSQAPGPPYTALWSRVQGFAFDDLAGLLRTRAAVRIVTLRGTVHLHDAGDALALRPFTQASITRQFASNHRKRIPEFDEVAAVALARERLADGPATGPQLAAALHARWPDAPSDALSSAARALLPLVQIPPRGLWGHSGPPTYALLDEWTGHPMRAADPTTVVRRYLAAFGPATVKDAQAWCGVTGLRAAFAALGDALTCFTGPSGEQLYDLADAPRPPAEVPAPVRLLPEWDNLLIGYADRTRIIDPELRQAIFTANGIVPGTVLLDGRVAATYKPILAEQRVVTRLLVPAAARAVDAIAEEATALMTAMGCADPTIEFDRSAIQ